MSALSPVLAGLAAGAAGTTALNAVTYLDMTWRGRPSSSTPEDTVEKLSEKTGVGVPGDEQARENRLGGLGPLSGLAVGVGVGGLLGLLRSAGVRPGTLITGLIGGAVAMAATDGSMAVLDVSAPRTWKPADWVADAVPHLAYGLATAWVLGAIERPAR